MTSPDANQGAPASVVQSIDQPDCNAEWPRAGITYVRSLPLESSDILEPWIASWSWHPQRVKTTERDIDNGGTRDQIVCETVDTHHKVWLKASCLVMGLLLTSSRSSQAQVVYPAKTTPQVMMASPQASQAYGPPLAVAPPLAITPPLAVAPPVAVAQAPLAVPQSPLPVPQASLQCLATPQASPQSDGIPQCACYYPQGYCPFPSGNCAFPSGNCRAPEGSCVGAQPCAEWPRSSPQASPQLVPSPTAALQRPKKVELTRR
jgi:hypothetical protein